MSTQKIQFKSESSFHQLAAPPSLVDCMTRERLNAFLPQSEGTCITAIVAPAGYGKTTLMAQFYQQLEAQNQACTWLNLEEADNHLTTFLMKLFRLCQEQNEEVGKEALQALSIGPMGSFRPYLISWIEDIEKIDAPFTLFLDDLHLIQDLQVLACLHFLLSHPPKNLLMVFTSRHKPPLPLTQLQLSGHLKLILTKDLCFNHEETQQFLAQNHGNRIEEDQLTQLLHSTEGWPAALRMLSLCQQSFQEALFLKGRQGIWSYLGQELTSQLDQEELNFLLQVCHLNHLHKDLCNHVCNISHSQELFERFEKKGFFILAIDRQRQWFRLHTLFREFLMEMNQKQSPQNRKKICRLASQWHTSIGDEESAISYALKAQDYDQVCSLLEKQIFHWIHYLGDYSKWIKTVEKLPKEYQKIPMIHLHTVLALAMKREFLLAEQLLKQVGMQSVTKDANLMLIYEALWIILHGLKDEVSLCIKKAPQWLKKWKGQEVIWQARVIAALGDAYLLQHHVQETHGWMSKALEHAYKKASPHGIMWLSMILSNIYEQRGELSKCENLLSRALHYLTQVNGSQIIAIPTLSLYLANILWQKGQVLAAQSYFKKALRLKISDHTYIETQIRAYCLLNGIAQLEKNWLKAEKLLLEGESEAKRNASLRLRVSLMAERVQLYFKSGASCKAHQTLKEFTQNFIDQAESSNLKDYTLVHYKKIQQCLKNQNSFTEPFSLAEKLTSREKEIILMMHSAMTREEIATYLEVSLNTLKQHLKNIYGKFGVNSRYALIQKSQHSG